MPGELERLAECQARAQGSFAVGYLAVDVQLAGAARGECRPKGVQFRQSL